MTSQRRACIYQGCPYAATDGSRCPIHQRKKRPWVKSNPKQYGWAWQDKRKRVLAEEGACRVCGNTELLEVDHIIPRAEGGTEDRSNLQVLCHTHHRFKTQQEALRGARRAG